MRSRGAERGRGEESAAPAAAVEPRGETHRVRSGGLRGAGGGGAAARCRGVEGGGGGEVSGGRRAAARCRGAEGEAAVVCS